MNQKDFVVTVQILVKLFPLESKGALSQRLTRIKQKLKKPNGGFVLASEYASLKGISIDQLNGLIYGNVVANN